jgi:hypothetical protein
VREAYPDLTAQDKGSKYYDAKASPEDPRWSMVDFKLVSGRLDCSQGGTDALVVAAEDTTSGCPFAFHNSCHP